MAAPALLSIKTVHGLVVGQAVDVSDDRLLLDINGPVEFGIPLEFRLELPGADETVLGTLRLRRSGRGLTQADVVAIAEEDQDVFDLWWRSFEQGRFTYRPSVALGRGGGRSEMHGASETETETALSRIDERRARFKERFDKLRGEPTEEDTGEIFVHSPLSESASASAPPAATKTGPPGGDAPPTPQRPAWMDMASADAAPLCPRPDGHFGTGGHLRDKARPLTERYPAELLALVQNVDATDTDTDTTATDATATGAADTRAADTRATAIDAAGTDTGDIQDPGDAFLGSPDLAALDADDTDQGEPTWDPSTWEDQDPPVPAVAEVLPEAAATQPDDDPPPSADAGDEDGPPPAPTAPHGPLVALTGTASHPVLAVAWSDAGALSASLSQGLAAGILRLPADQADDWPAQARVHILTPGGIDLEVPGLRLGRDGEALLYQLTLAPPALQQLQQEGLRSA